MACECRRVRLDDKLVRTSWTREVCSALSAAGAWLALASATSAQLSSLRIEDYATMPMTGAVTFPSATVNSAYLARVNFLRDEPGATDRFFVNDLNGPLYILDKSTRQFTEYLNFNGRGSAAGLFDRLYTSAGFATGLITFQFDPGYADLTSQGYGKFYTVHVEQGTSGSELPDTLNYPSLDISNYGVTPSIDAPGNAGYINVLVEWTDTNIDNATFEGSARELLRMDARDRIHPMGDIIFNPTAGPDDPDWRVMYVSVGDAGNGEQMGGFNTATRRTPQLLNALGGKILRIIPDVDGENTPSTASPNGKYSIPNDNPFTADPRTAVHDEVFALGLRNPHRMSWDVDPSDPNNNHLLVSEIGLHTWEEVNIVAAGMNYGYSRREGNEELHSDNETGPLPSPDTIPQDLVCTGGIGGFSNCTDKGAVTPVYPVIQYGHGLAGQDPIIAGDSVSSGFVYRGSAIPELYGKYVFGDITTGAIYVADFDDMLAADDGDPATLSEFEALDILWDNPNDPAGEKLFTTLTSDQAIRGPMFQIVDAAYHARGGEDPNLPGAAPVTGPFGRSDIRLAVDDAGELYILSKSDGMIRRLIGPSPPQITGDFDDDGDVDDDDYGAWVASFGDLVPVPGMGADGNENGVVDTADYVIWRHAIAGDGVGRAASVPEPGAAALSLAAAILLLNGLPRRR